MFFKRKKKGQAILEKFNIADPEAFWQEVFQPHIGLFSEGERERLAKACVAIPGLGGAGGTHLISMVRSGVGRFRLADFDCFEPRNISRQYGARISDLGRPKVEVMAEEALNINPHIQIETFPEGINEENIDRFLDGVDVILDGIEFFSFEARRLLYDKAREKGICVVIAAPLGFSAAMLVFHPTKSPSFEEYFGITPEMSKLEKAIAFALGLAPKPLFLKYMDLDSLDLKAGRGPASVIACYLCSALVSMEAIRIILGRPGLKPVPHYLLFDLYLKKFHLGYLRGGYKNPWQRIKFHLLKRKLRT